jgi:hypothetical protein
MREFARLLYLLIIVLPLTILLLGPLLILAALRGVQHIGPIVLNPGRRGVLGRFGALLLGMIAWLAVWGGLAIILAQAGLPGMQGLSSSALRANSAPTAAPLIPSSTATLAPSPTPLAIAVLSPTPSPSPEVMVPDPSPTPSPLPPTATSVLPTATATPLPATPAPAPTATLTPGSPLAAQQADGAIAAVEKANQLLGQAAMEPSISNLAALEVAWQDRALAKAQAFAQHLYEQYPHPLQVSFVYLKPPTAQAGDVADRAIVTSSEAWTYTAPRTSHTEAFEFIYTLDRRDGDWVITSYTYRNAPNALPTAAVETPSLLTNTVTLTSTTVITSPRSN